MGPNWAAWGWVGAGSLTCARGYSVLRLTGCRFRLIVGGPNLGVAPQGGCPARKCKMSGQPQCQDALGWVSLWLSLAGHTEATGTSTGQGLWERGLGSWSELWAVPGGLRIYMPPTYITTHEKSKETKKQT